jgi:hypothetical protein
MLGMMNGVGKKCQHEGRDREKDKYREKKKERKDRGG